MTHHRGNPVRGPFLLVVLSFVLASPVALAETPLETSPERGGVVGGQVDRVQLLFLQPVDVVESFVVVTDPSGAAVPSAGALTADDSGRRITAPIRRLSEPGLHRVDYRVVSQTGAISVGSYEFTFEPAASSPQGVEPPESADGGGLWNRWTALGAVILAGAAVVVWRGRKAWRRW